MISFKLDSDNNLVFNSNISTVSGNEAIAQDARNRLLMFKTEYPFDLEQGIDYYDLAKQNNKTSIENAIIERILEDNRIKSVSLIEVSFTSKQLSVQAECVLPNGDVINV